MGAGSILDKCAPANACVAGAVDRNVVFIERGIALCRHLLNQKEVSTNYRHHSDDA
jgi:hypothetical protein